MTPAEALTTILPRWRAGLPPELDAQVDDYVERNREFLLAVIEETLAIGRAKKGLRPRTVPEYLGYQRLAARELRRGDEADDAVARRLVRRVEKMMEKEPTEEGRQIAAAFGLAFAQLRALAIVLQAQSWAAVPLMVRRPALAIGKLVADEPAVLGVVDDRGRVHWRTVVIDDPHNWKAWQHSLGVALRGAQERVADLSADIGDGASLHRHAMALWARARAQVAASEPRVIVAVVGDDEELPPDARTKKWRTEANLQAMRLVLAKEPGELTAEDRKILGQYSGWGGLSIESVEKMIPPELVPETFGLIHEYYTPTAIAEAIVEALCPFLTEVAGNDGVVRALEPSAGIGRLVRAFSPRRCLELEAGGHIKKIEWAAVEFSKVSSTLLRALRPDIDLYHMPFERWARDEGPRYRGTLGLVVSNPPYGERGAMAREDPDAFYSEKRAYAYFMRRALDLLVPGGIGVFLIPAGFLSGNLNRGLREKILLRHHLLGAYRLPSHDRRGRETVPGASVVMDVVFWRSRGGELTEIDEADRGIWEGDYFKEYPGHILGEEDGFFRGDDEAGTARSWRYKVTGDFEGLPPLRPRPLCTACVLAQIIVGEDTGTFQTVVAREGDDIPKDVDPNLRPALELGRRVGRYLAAVGADEGEKAAQLWPELHAALLSLRAAIGNPWSSEPLRELAGKKVAAAEHLYLAFDKTGALTPALSEPPHVEPKFSGQPGDVVAQAEALYRQRRALKVSELMDFHRAQGGDLDDEAALDALFEAEWNLDGDAWDELYPRDAYLTGNLLWERYDRAKTRADAGDEQARVQARRLLEAIGPAVFDDITDLSPQHGYVPLDLVAGWISETLNARYGSVELEREEGLVQIAGRTYTDERKDSRGISPDTLAFLGYYNHDPALFQPPKEKRDPLEGPMTREERAAKKQNLAERRIALSKKWADSFQAWVAADDDRREQITNAYNRVARGRIVPTFPPEPLEIARWGAQAPKLRAHQIAGARRVLAQRGGLVAFDVGVGKTYTALAIIALGRQEGWVRRPVILVPLSLVWKWHDDVLCTLPDYRIAVIGSRRRRLTQGPRKGTMISEPDSPQERAEKWTMLQTGQLDVVILSFTALSKTKMNESVVMDYITKVEAVERSVALRRRSLKEKVKTQKDKDKLSERERALLEHGVSAWVEETLALPPGQEYDPGIAWDEIGIDMLVVDEAAAFKNLYMPQPREDGVPKFMGSGGEGSERAWQLDFRAAAVRQKTGGAGIVLLTATPAKNSPLEFYNLIQFIDPAAFTRAGIHDPEQFIDRFLKIEYREVLDSTFEVTRKSAVTGFKNLDDLRTIIFTYGEFRTGAEVGLKLPRPVVETITIEMDDEQEAKYDRYVKQIEEILENPNPEGAGQSFAILGILVRLSMVALHSAADEGYNYKTALEGGSVQRTVYQDGEPYKVTVSLPRPHYESPKLVECAKRVAASPHCGHIIFVEPTAVHQWMREVLVDHGIARERIAILNADATGADDRIRIAREFNGLSSEAPAPGTCARPGETAIAPKYDVVIANSVAYEGIDLQVRTCTIHHLDLPWTPSDLEQRNGRAVRQGNTLGTVQIFYYFADSSTDGYRFSLIDGKAGWLGQLIKSQVRDTNNPAAQQQLTQEDVLLMISRNKEKTKALIEDKKRKAAEEARAKIAKEAARLLRQASARFRDARASQDPDKAARLRDEGQQRLEDLQSISAEAWPWAPWITAVRDHVMIVPENGGAPVYEGLRIARPRAGAPDEIEFLEFGQVIVDAGGEKIGLRAAGSPGWQLLTYEGTIAGTSIAPEHLPREGGPMWPDDDDARTAEAIERRLETLFPYQRFETLGWRGASDDFLEKWWPRFAEAITKGLARSHFAESVPVVDDEGLAIAKGAEIEGSEILPPTLAGWRRYLELSPKSGESFTTLREAGLGWWGRKIPPNLLSGAKDAEAEEEEEAGPRLPRFEASPLHQALDAAFREILQRAGIGSHGIAMGFADDAAQMRPSPDLEAKLRRKLAQVLGRTSIGVDRATSDALVRRAEEIIRAEAATQATPSGSPAGAQPARAVRTTPRGLPVGEIAAADLARAEELVKGASGPSDESRDQSLLDSFVMRLTAMQDALAMGGASNADRKRQWDEGMKKILAFVALRAQAIVLGGHGYDARLLGNLDTAGLAIVRDGRPLALVDQRGLWLFPGLAAVDELFADVDAARARTEELMTKHMDRESLDKTALAVWRAARAGGQPPESAAQVSEERSVSRPESAPTRDDRAAAKALVRRLNLMPQGVRLGDTRYGMPTVEAIEGDVEITFQGPVADDGGVPLLILRATPRGDDALLRGELQDGDARVTASFGPITVKRSELVRLRETSLSRWFGVETTPEARLSPSLRDALVRLEKERQDVAPDEQLTWPGVDDGIKDEVIARGLVIAIENPGGFPHYRLTARGREMLDTIEAASAKGEPATQTATPTSTDDAHDQARSELRALGLSAKQHTKFLRQLDTAIASGKSAGPVLARARKAAAKAAKGTTSGRSPEPSTLAAIVDTFDAEPRWRLKLERPRPSGYVFGVYREGGDPSDTIASIEVIDFDVDDARWLSDRLSLADQDEILARLERALWVGVDVDEKRAEESRSPIEDLIAAMERRAGELGVDPRKSLSPGRTDGYASIAAALRDLATPVGMAADELERWLENRDFFLAAEVVARSRVGVMPVDTLLGDLWSAVFDHFTIVKVQGEAGRLRVPRFAVQGQGDRYVLLADTGGSRPRRIFVVVRGEDDEGSTLIVDDPAGHLQRGSEVFTGDLDEVLLDNLYRNLSEFEEGLRRAPRTLGDVRLLLYWATAMLDAPLCQGEVKKASARAIEQAHSYYDAARRQLAEGQPVEAVRRMHAALRRISKAAAEIGQSCAEGQLPVPGADPALQVAPADVAAIKSPRASDGETAVRAAAPPSRRPSVMASAAWEVFK